MLQPPKQLGQSYYSNGGLAKWLARFDWMIQTEIGWNFWFLISLFYNVTSFHRPMYHQHQKMMMEDYERSRGMKGPPQEKMLIPQNPAQYATTERGYHYHTRPLNGESATLMSNKSKGKRKGSRDE